MMPKLISLKLPALKFVARRLATFHELPLTSAVPTGPRFTTRSGPEPTVKPRSRSPSEYGAGNWLCAMADPAAASARETISVGIAFVLNFIVFKLRNGDIRE